MPAGRPSLARALLAGSWRHFLAAFVGPVAVAVAAAALHTRSLNSDLFRVALIGMPIVMGALFLFHEAVALIALAYRLRRRPDPESETDVAVDMLTAVIGTDLVATTLGLAFLSWRGVERFGELTPLLIVLAPGLYGVHLLGRRVREAVAAPGAPPDAPPGATAGAAPRRRPSWGLQVYVTTAVATLAFAALGWEQGTGPTFGIAVVSILVGRVVAVLAR